MTSALAHARRKALFACLASAELVETSRLKSPRRSRIMGGVGSGRGGSAVDHAERLRDRVARTEKGKSNRGLTFLG